MVGAYIKFVAVLFAITNVSTVTLENHRRQLTPDCPLPVLKEKIEAIPLDPKTGERECWKGVQNFTGISPQEYAQRREEVFGLLFTICSDVCLPTIANLVDSCFKAYRVPLSLACGFNGQMQCWQLPTLNTGEDVAQACYAHNETSACPEDCSDELVELVELGGCCVNNVFNTTIFGPDLKGLNVVNNLLWEACSMSKVLFCPTPKAFSAPVPTYFPTSGYVGHYVSLPLSLLVFACVASN